MNLNKRSHWVVESHARRTPRSAKWPLTRSSRGAGSSTAGSTPGAACRRDRPGAGLPGRPGATSRSSPGDDRRTRRALWSKSSPTIRSAACLASQYAGWAISEGKYFAMGSGPMRAAWRQGANLRQDRRPRGGRVGRRRARDAEGADRRPSSPRSPQPAASAPQSVTLLVAPTASLAGSAPDRRAVGRDGPPQARRARLRPRPRRVRAGLGAASAGRRQRPRRHRPDQRRHPLRCPRRPVRDRRRRQPRRNRPQGPFVQSRTTTASPSRPSSPATITTSTPSTPTCSARRRSSSTTSTPAASTPSAKLHPTSWSVPSSR